MDHGDVPRLTPVVFVVLAAVGALIGACSGSSTVGEHCCNDLTLNTHVCAASCSGGVADVAC